MRSAKGCRRVHWIRLYVGMHSENRRLERKKLREKEEERRKNGEREGRKGDRAMHVKNYTSAYISPATSGVILAISRRWEPEPEFFLSFSFSPLFPRSLSLLSRMLFSAQLSHRRHAPLVREEHSLMLHFARWVISGSETGEKCYNCYVYRFEKLLVVTWERNCKTKS